MTYEELRSKMLGLGMYVDRVLYYRAVDGGRSDRVEGVAYNLVDSGDVRIFASDGRGGFFQKPGKKTVFGSVSAACEWIWRDVRFHEAPQLLTDAERQHVIDEAQASIDGFL